MLRKVKSPALGNPLSPEDRGRLTRFLDQGLDHGFRLAIVEVRSFFEREQILAFVAPIIGQGLLRVALEQFKGDNFFLELLELYRESQPRCLALSGFMNHPDRSWIQQINIQRDLFVRDIKVPWLLFVHPAARVPLLESAPDFCDFAVLWICNELVVPDDSAVQNLDQRQPQLDNSPLPPGVSDWMLAEASRLIDVAQFDQAADFLGRLGLRRDLTLEEQFFCRVLAARLAHRLGKLRTADNSLRACRAELAELPASSQWRILLGLVDLELGAVAAAQAKYPQAEALLDRAMASFRMAAGEEHPDFARAMGTLAGVLSMKGDYVDAENMLRRTLDLYKRVRGPKHPDYAATLHSLAGVLSKQGRYAEAKDLYRRALKLKELALTPQHPDYGAALHALAGVLSRQGEHAEAVKLLRRALTIFENSLGVDHPAFGSALHALAGVLSKQGEYVEAEVLLRRTVGLYRKALGESHPDFGTALHALAGVLSKQGKYAEAEALLRRALAIKELALGQSHPVLSASLINLARVLFLQGRADEAEPIARRALVISEKVHGKQHPEVGQILIWLALIQAELEQPVTAATARRAVRVLTESLGAEHAETQGAVRLLQPLL